MRASHNARNLLLAILALTLAFGGAASAGDGSVGCWALRGVVARMDTDNNLFLDLGNERRANFLNAGTGLGLSYEYRRGCRWGFEIGFLTAELGSLFVFDSVLPPFWGKDPDDVLFSALTLGPTFHLTPGKRADLYVGPLIALPEFDSGNYRPMNMLDVPPGFDPVFRQDFDADLAWGFQVGLDWPLRRRSPWAFHLGAKYLALEVDTGAALPGTLDVDPTIWTAGLSYSPSGCRDCQDDDPCARLRRRQEKLGCSGCSDEEECRGPPSCEECRGLACDDCPLPPTCDELDCDCPGDQTCRDEPTCEDFPADCQIACPGCDELGCAPPVCPPGQFCRPLYNPRCEPGLECRRPPSCEDLRALDCATCPEGEECREPGLPCDDCPLPPCPTGQTCYPEPLDCADFPAECREDCETEKTWHLCCLILIGLVTLWLIWWVFRRRGLWMAWFWLFCPPLVCMIGKLWFFKSATEQAWLLGWLMIALVLVLLFGVLRLLDLKRWIRLLLAGLMILVLLALGKLAAWSWLWWFLLAAMALLLLWLLWRSWRGDRYGLARLILLAVLILVLILLGKLALWVWAWKLLVIVLALLLLHWMARWLHRREEPAGEGGWWLAVLAVLVVVVWAGVQTAAGWLWWFLLILAIAAVIYLLRRWLGDPRHTWLALLAVLIILLLLFGELAGWSWLWWFLLIGLVLLLLCLIWRRRGGPKGPEPPGIWLVLIVVLVLVLLLLGSAAGYGWLWWFLLCLLLLPLLWLLWRLLGGSGQAACAVLALPLVVILFWLGKLAAWQWLGWLGLAAAVVLVLYLLGRGTSWCKEPKDRLRLWLCLLVLLILTLVCLGHLAGWAGHWWLVLLALALLLAGVAWRLLGSGLAGLGQLVWLGLLLIALVLAVLLGASAGPSWLKAILTCALLAALPAAIWAVWFHTAGGFSGLGAACAAGMGNLREFQQRLEPIAKADPTTVRDLFLAYRDRRGWSDMYALYEAMSDQLKEDLEVRQQLAFALNRDGRDSEAEEVLTGLEGDDERSAESWGLLGRIYKDRWDAARKLAGAAAEAGDDLAATSGALLEKAIRAYLAGHRAAGGKNPYPGINALTLAEFDDRRRAELDARLPDELEAALAAGPEEGDDYWHHATRLELAIHRDDEDGARQALARARHAARPSPTACPQVWKVETTVRNLRLIEEGRRDRGAALPAWASEVIAGLEGAGGGPPRAAEEA